MIVHSSSLQREQVQHISIILAKGRVHETVAEVEHIFCAHDQ